MAQRLEIQYVQFYTQGSAARQVTPAISRDTGALPKMKKRKAKCICIDPVAIFGMAVAVCLFVMMMVGVAQLNKEQERTAEMEQYVQMLTQENAVLQAQFDAECDLEAIAETALALGMVPAEKVALTVISVELPETPEPETITLWERIGTFLSGLFA